MPTVRHSVSPPTRTLAQRSSLCSALLLALVTACSQDAESPSGTDQNVTTDASMTASTSSGTTTSTQTTATGTTTSMPTVTATVTMPPATTTAGPSTTTPATSSTPTVPPTMAPPDSSEGTGGTGGTGPDDSGAGAAAPEMSNSAPSMSGTGGSMPMASSSAGAGAGGMEGTGGGGDTGFAPCPTEGPCVILPLGDSITDGVGVPGGGSYRIELFSLALADGKDITYVGGSMNGPEMVDGTPFPRAHEGHSGWTIQQIDDITPDPSLGDSPNIVLLHIGTNDMYQTPAGAPDRLGALIDQILDTLPDSLLVVSTIIPFPGGSGPTATYNAAVPGVVEERVNAGKHILFVDQFEGFPESELADGVHPNTAGYARMAGVWYEAIKSYLP